MESGKKEEEVSVHDLTNLTTSVAEGENVDKDNIIEWIECDTNDPGSQNVTDEQTVEEALSKNLEESDEVDGKVQKKVSQDATLAHVEGLIQYLEEEEDASLCDKIVIKKTSIPNKEEVFQCKKQKLLTDFLKK